ncbi:hypothetical protein [Lacticaseibacillus mingshuiensis]|uniref:Uncharacterized protein n=1 Tax=Lacticaseibacillus mingshuiensis TaxID=2799574 RepID=A0ABW4CKG5_9LACO|nr:hypothetical protein [Lacticaseibacillus mingshuiensis]
MDDDEKSTSQKGLGLVSLLTLILVAAKAFGFATYSWMWAFMPIVASAVIVIGFILIAFIAVGVETILDQRKHKW